MNETIWLPSLFFKSYHGRKPQTIFDLNSDSTTGLTRREVAAAIDSPTNCVSVMINQINKANWPTRAGKSTPLTLSGNRGVAARRAGAIGSCAYRSLCRNTAAVSAAPAAWRCWQRSAALRRGVRRFDAEALSGLIRRCGVNLALS